MSYDQGSQPPPGWGTPSPQRPGYIAPRPYACGAPPRDHPNDTTVPVWGIAWLLLWVGLFTRLAAR